MQRAFLPWHHHPGHPDVVVPVRVDPTGRLGPTPKAARCGRWRSVGTGWFVPSYVDGSRPEQRIVEAAVHLGAYGAVTGWAALHWRGARWFDGTGASGPRAVVLATGDRGPRHAPGVVMSQERLSPADIEVVDGLRVTTAVRSVLFEMRYAPHLVGAVQVVDMACYADLVSLDEASAYAAELRSCTGIPVARDAIALGDENAWSPAEVAARLLWVRDAALPAPLSNRPVFDLAGRRVVTPDLLDPVAGLVCEYDGLLHLDRGAHRRDLHRDELYRRLGLEEVVLTVSDVSDPGRGAARLLEAHQRAVLSTRSRQWTLDPPPTWRPTHTVALRRALPEGARRRLLRYREAS